MNRRQFVVAGVTAGGALLARDVVALGGTAIQKWPELHGEKDYFAGTLCVSRTEIEGWQQRGWNPREVLAGKFRNLELAMLDQMVVEGFIDGVPV